MTDVLIVGGGIAGLTAASLLGRAGKSVVLLEQAEHLGGRAVTNTTSDGFQFNTGPHALYLGGHAMRVLRELRLEIAARKVGTSGSFTVIENTLHTFPSGPVSMFSTGLFNLSERLESLRFLARLGGFDSRPLDSTSVHNWLDTQIRQPRVRLFVEALIRVSSYTNAPDLMSAGAALEQLQLAFREGVAYIDGGWQTMVSRLRDAAVSAGATLRTGSHVHAIECESGGFKGILLDDGTRIRAGSVVLAVPPKQVGKLLSDADSVRLRRWIDGAIPVRAASLELALQRLPQPSRTFALALDKPLYLSVHSRWADLAPKGAALVYVAKYLPADESSDAAQDRHELEQYMDLVQPGWRTLVVHQRFLPNMPVTHAVIRARDGGLSGRPGVDAAGVRNVYIAGDWVGAEGMLADAAFASAARIAQVLMSTRELEAVAV